MHYLCTIIALIENWVVNSDEIKTQTGLPNGDKNAFLIEGSKSMRLPSNHPSHILWAKMINIPNLDQTHIQPFVTGIACGWINNVAAITLFIC
jgi:hypothetical protein